MKNKYNIKDNKLVILTTIASFLMMLSIISPSVIAPYDPVNGYDFYGYDMVSLSWTKGNLAGYFEGDMVSYMLVIDADPGEDLSSISYYANIIYDFFVSKDNSITDDNLLPEFCTQIATVASASKFYEFRS